MASSPEPHNLFQMLPRPQQDDTTRSWDGGAVKSPKGSSSGSAAKGRHQSGLQESEGKTLTPKPHNLVTDSP